MDSLFSRIFDACNIPRNLRIFLADIGLQDTTRLRMDATKSLIAMEASYYDMRQTVKYVRTWSGC